MPLCVPYAARTLGRRRLSASSGWGVTSALAGPRLSRVSAVVALVVVLFGGRVDDGSVNSRFVFLSDSVIALKMVI